MFVAIVATILVIVLVSMLIFQRHMEFSMNTTNIPKVIWTFWDGEEMPEIVKRCLKSYAIHNPDYKIIVLDKTNINRYIDLDIGKLVHNDSLQRLSDFVRINVLTQYGGIWTDASIVCTRSLAWVHEPRTAFVGFYLSAFTRRRDSPVIENWWFACARECPFMKAWRDEFMTINNYASVSKYLEDVSGIGIMYDGIDSPNYLAMHVACQVVLQNNPKYLKQMTLFQAEKTAFTYLAANNWDSESGVKTLCTINHDKPMIVKLRGVDRDFLARAAQESESCLDNLFSTNNNKGL